MKPQGRTCLRHGLVCLAIHCALYGYAQWLEEARGCTSSAPLRARTRT
ncbi:hypothetical protein [Streptomyces aureoversilis]|uniref:Uncharacterized protein n=1 Tax=Streptomyces aureoversilis TaxID=67277 RepID=A0ABW0A301_9ACTN